MCVRAALVGSAEIERADGDVTVARRFRCNLGLEKLMGPLGNRDRAAIDRVFLCACWSSSRERNVFFFSSRYVARRVRVLSLRVSFFCRVGFWYSCVSCGAMRSPAQARRRLWDFGSNPPVDGRKSGMKEGEGDMVCGVMWCCGM